MGTAYTAAIGTSAFIAVTGMSAFTVAIGVPAITDTGAIGLSPFMATEATGIMDTEAIAATATTPAGDDSGRLNLLRWSR